MSAVEQLARQEAGKQGGSGRFAVAGLLGLFEGQELALEALQLQRDDQANCMVIEP